MAAEQRALHGLHDRVLCSVYEAQYGVRSTWVGEGTGAMLGARPDPESSILTNPDERDLLICTYSIAEAVIQYLLEWVSAREWEGSA